MGIPSVSFLYQLSWRLWWWLVLICYGSIFPWVIGRCLVNLLDLKLPKTYKIWQELKLLVWFVNYRPWYEKAHYLEIQLLDMLTFSNCLCMTIYINKSIQKISDPYVNDCLFYKIICKMPYMLVCKIQN